MTGKILACIKDTPTITIPGLAAQLDVSPSTIERNLKKLQAENQLRRIGAAKGGYWEVIP